MQSGNHVHQETRTEDAAGVSFEKNLTLISFLLKGDHELAAKQLQKGFVKSREFAQFLQRHRLQLFVCSLLGGSPVQESLPREWVDELRIFSLRQWATQERLVKELEEISTLLAAAGHESILLKGPYWATRFFGSLHRREFSDLDILIRREDLPAVGRLLCSCGYMRKSTVLLNEALTARFTHALDFVKPNVALDLHWLLSANAGHSLNYDAIWQQRQAFVLRNQKFFVLPDEYEVVFSLISIFKDLERGVTCLKEFVDLYLILSKLCHRLDWGRFLENRKREGIEQITINVLALFLDLFDCADRFPEVARAVAREHRLIKRVSSEKVVALLEASPGALRNKLWAASIYECSRIHVFLWWLVSLPFRLTVHQPDKYRRIQRGVEYIKNYVRPKSAADV
jgi:Uncharacterised nucleotidyltransferase